MKSLIIFLLGIAMGCNTQQIAPTLRIRQGQVQGVVETSRNGQPYHSYKGIPYGLVVTRFESAVPARGWNGVRNATRYGPICPQTNLLSKGKLPMSEDCLHISVYVPANRTANRKLPVMAWIYGGGFQWGYVNGYGPQYLIDEGVIMVAFNYRVGIFGFLHTDGDPVIQGNMGLKDQVLALRWVRDNIEAFGGDRERVTIFGESAGGSSVMYHLVSEQSRGLFQNGISTSGSALNVACIPNQIYRVAEQLRCPSGTRDGNVIAQCLRRASVRDLLAVRTQAWNLDPFVPFHPVVEVPRKNQPPSELFIRTNPQTSLEQGRFNRVPLLHGIMELEGLLIEADTVMEIPGAVADLNKRFDQVAPYTFNLYVPGNDTNGLLNITRAVRRFYFGSQSIGNETYEQLGRLYSDRVFIHGSRRQVLEHARQQVAPVYAFMLGFRGNNTRQYLNPFRPNVTTHGDDLNFIFPASDEVLFSQISPGSPEERFSRRLVNIYGHFAKTGRVPVANWHMVSQAEVGNRAISWYHLNLNGSRHIEDPFTRRMQFWDEIQPRLLVCEGGDKGVNSNNSSQNQGTSSQGNQRRPQGQGQGQSQSHSASCCKKPAVRGHGHGHGSHNNKTHGHWQWQYA